MSSHLVRRGGIWWVRLAVPLRLREQAGRREFTQSCRTHELAIAKLVAAFLLADWRKKLLKLDSHQMPLDVLKIVDGSPALAGGGWMSLVEAANLSGIGKDQLLRAAADGSLKLFCRLGQVAGYDLPFDLLDPVSPEVGRSGGVVVPQPQFMPSGASEATGGGVMAVYDSSDVASSVLAECLDTATILLFEVPDQPGMVFAPDQEVRLKIEKFEIVAADVEAMRQRLKPSISQDAIDRAQALRIASVKGVALAWKKAEKRFSEAVEAYATDKSGLPSDLNSEIEQRQRKKGLLVFGDFMGDMPIGEIGSDKLREFRDGPLRTLPAKANNLPKALKRESMRETVEVIRDAGVDWPVMSYDMQHERILWLSRLFGWLRTKEWIKDDPSVSLRGESGLTKAERKELKREIDPEDDGRGPFNPDELNSIFEQAWFKTGNGSHIKKPSYWYLPITFEPLCRLAKSSNKFAFP